MNGILKRAVPYLRFSSPSKLFRRNFACSFNCEQPRVAPYYQQNYGSNFRRFESFNKTQHRSFDSSNFSLCKTTPLFSHGYRNFSHNDNWYTNLFLFISLMLFGSTTVYCKEDTTEKEASQQIKSDEVIDKFLKALPKDIYDDTKKSSDDNNNKATGDSIKKQSPENRNSSSGTAINRYDTPSPVNSPSQETNRQLAQKAEIVKNIMAKKLTESGTCGLSVVVSIDGRLIYQAGYGTADLQCSLPSRSSTKYRIASISKPLTAVIAMKLAEVGLLDLDKPISQYLSEKDWPDKYVDGKKVEITCRHLLTHTAGVRHYSLKKPKKSKKANDKDAEGSNKTENDDKVSKYNSGDKITEDNFEIYVEYRRQKLSGSINSKIFRDKKAELKRAQDKSDLCEYYINQFMATVQSSVDLFKNDSLFFKPGTDFSYTTHGYTLLSRVIEVVTGRSFSDLSKQLFHTLKMYDTYLDSPEKIIPGRAACYQRDHNHELKIAPYVDNSYKWAGGGFLSNAVDLVSFGNLMLYALQTTDHMIEKHGVAPGFLNSSSVREMWSPHVFIKKVPSPNNFNSIDRESKRESSVLESQSSDVGIDHTFRGYGLGWVVRAPRTAKRSSLIDSCMCGTEQSSLQSHETNVVESTTSPAKSANSKTKIVEVRVPSNVKTILPRNEVPPVIIKDPNAKPDNELKSNNEKPAESKDSDERCSSIVECHDYVDFCPHYENFCCCEGFIAYHTGAAVGGSSVLLIAPRGCDQWAVNEEEEGLEGVRDVPEMRQTTDLHFSKSGTENKKKDDGGNYGFTSNKEVKIGKLLFNNSSKIHQQYKLEEEKCCHICHADDACKLGLTGSNCFCPSIGRHPYGIVVTILGNTTGVNFTEEAIKIAGLYKNFQVS